MRLRKNSDRAITMNHGDVFDDEKIFCFAVDSGKVADGGVSLTTDITDKRVFREHGDGEVVAAGRSDG